MKDLQLTDGYGDSLTITSSKDALCEIVVNGYVWECSPLHANKIIEKLTEVINQNK